MRIIATALIIISYLCTSCTYTQQATKDFSLLLNKPKPELWNKINFGGAYHHIPKESYHFPIKFDNGVPIKFVDSPFLGKPILFFQNGLVLFVNSLILDTNIMKSLLIHAAPSKGDLYNWGTFETAHDTIKAILYMMYYSQTSSKRYMFLESHFEAIIADKDTIRGWHLVSPYPTFGTDLSQIEICTCLNGKKKFIF